MAKPKLDTSVTSADMDHLWSSVHATRDGTASVKVDKAAITRLLIDHSKLLNAVLK